MRGGECKEVRNSCYHSGLGMHTGCGHTHLSVDDHPHLCLYSLGHVSAQPRCGDGGQAAPGLVSGSGRAQLISQRCQLEANGKMGLGASHRGGLPGEGGRVCFLAANMQVLLADGYCHFTFEGRQIPNHHLLPLLQPVSQ